MAIWRNLDGDIIKSCLHCTALVRLAAHPKSRRRHRSGNRTALPLPATGTPVTKSGDTVDTGNTSEIRGLTASKTVKCKQDFTLNELGSADAECVGVCTMFTHMEFQRASCAVHEVPLMYGSALAPARFACYSKTTHFSHPPFIRYGICSTVSQSACKFATSPADPRSWGGLETYAARTGGFLHRLRSNLPRSVKASGL